MAAEVQAGLRKRQQIAAANRAMFIWVAGSSVIIGAAIVVSVFLIDKMIFTEKVIVKKQATSSVLSKNLVDIDTLKGKVRVLNTSSALNSVKLPDESDPIQVVLDALPSEANSTALGSTLQQKFLNLPGLTVQTLSVSPPQGDEAPMAIGNSTSTATSAIAANTRVSSDIITFHFVVIASDSQTIATLLQNIEKSVRTIDLTNITLSYQQGTLQLTADGQAYYQPTLTTKLGSQKVNP